MRIRTVLSAVLVVVAGSLSARSQVLSIYATSTNTRASNIQTGTVQSGSGYTNQYTSFFASGIGGGITVGALPLGPVHLGFDLRGSTKPGTTGVDTAMAGLRFAVKPPLLPIKPYVQISGGYVATRTLNVTTAVTAGTFTNKYAAYEVFGGLDYKLLPILDFRVIEIGVGQGFNTGISFSSSQNATLFNINTGLVLHF